MNATKNSLLTIQIFERFFYSDVLFEISAPISLASIEKKIIYKWAKKNVMDETVSTTLCIVLTFLHNKK